MKRFYQKLIVSLIATLGLFLCFNCVLADSPDEGTWTFASGSGLDQTAKEIGYSDAPASPEQIIGNIITIILSLLGVVFLGLIIYGGIMWMTATGNEPTVNKAKKILEEAIIGLIIVLAAYAIVFFVIKYFSQNTLLTN